MKQDKRVRKLVVALQIIRTWCAVPFPHPGKNTDHILKLVEKTLEEYGREAS